LDVTQGHELDNIYQGQCCSACFCYCQYLLVNLRIIKKKDDWQWRYEQVRKIRLSRSVCARAHTQNSLNYEAMTAFRILDILTVSRELVDRSLWKKSRTGMIDNICESTCYQPFVWQLSTDLSYVNKIES